MKSDKLIHCIGISEGMTVQFKLVDGYEMVELFISGPRGGIIILCNFLEKSFIG